MRVRWFQCPTKILPVLPQRRRGTHLPEWMRQPTRPLPVQHPGRPGWLTPGQQWRANGGRS
ncbi:hypothetical protein C1I95_14630 [Micromonospora craterilacus]|uniref:Uncharacterized protein n=1 Tax=Micromonospora craterilacus TaxID=1655439 RepID=A0A2W2FS71_9ACTN|nr:hypothetical protein [Micromonospora craterilacus]PZG17864.1 hypothetical protein C1I95_14630 [Micromonospora craterilacus]